MFFFLRLLQFKTRHKNIYFFRPRLSSGFYCYNETPWPKSKSEGKGFNCLTHLYWCLSSNSTRAETWREELMQGHGRVLIIGLLPMAYSACFLRESRTTSLGLAPSTIVWDLHHWSQVPYSWIWWKHFLNESSLFSDCSSLCHIDIRLASTDSLSSL